MIRAARRFWPVLVLLIVLIGCLGSAMRAATGAPPVNLTYPPPPLLGAAAIVFDRDTKQVLFSEHPDKSLPMASTTKLMTALLVLEHGKLDTTTTVSYNAVAVGGSTMNLYTGEVLSLRNLLYGLMLPSGNDAAVALSEAVGGTEAHFVVMMNAKCAKLGCTHTHFTSPHGLDMVGEYASARDLLRIVQADLHYATFRGIVDTRLYSVPAGPRNNAHYLVNVNEPLWWYPGVVGAKPGNTDNAAFCDVIVARQGKRHVIVVALGMPDRFTDVRDLLNFAFSNFTWHSPATVPATLENILFPADDFSGDSPYRYLIGQDAHGRDYRYYVGTGYYLQAPFLQYSLDYPALGLPTSEAIAKDGVIVQRLGTTTVRYTVRTATFSRDTESVKK
jgi:D-alanyl-D-alanine carboxypeptidase